MENKLEKAMGNKTENPNKTLEKIVVISGGSSGIGKELLRLFANDGYKTVCLSRSKPEGVECVFIRCDVSCESDITAAAQEIQKRFKSVDILINNAGVGLSGATELLPAASVKNVMDIDYLGAFMLSKAILPLMKEKSKIINVSSACALFALPFRSVYCSAKAAMNMLSFGMRMELRNTGIKVVSICPGDVKTPFTANRIKFFETNERYGDNPTLAAEKIDSRQDKRMSPEKVSKKIYKIAKTKSKALYIIGAKYKFLYFMQKLIPMNLFIKLTGKFFG